jgi:hypothetical protein
MMRVSCLALCVLFLSSTQASATPPETPTPTMTAASKLVQDKLLKPLASKEDERSKFSRARMPPQERRVRVLGAETSTDAKGQAFVAFAVDSRHGYVEVNEKNWRADTITGCVYPGSGEIFIAQGEHHRPASMLLGKKTKDAPDHVCHPSTVVADST